MPAGQRSDRREGDRRRTRDRRHTSAPDAGMRIPSWPEQRVQFLTRYLFIILGLVFFNRGEGAGPLALSLQQLNLTFLLYAASNTAMFVHARRLPYAPARYHAAMWVDIAIVTVAVWNDPHPIPPSVLVFIMIVLGNGMRYGMRLFAEAVVGCFSGAMVAFSLRYTGSVGHIGAGVAFLNLFGAIILVYAYFLMGRVESSRKLLERSSREDNLTRLLNRRALDEVSRPCFQEVAGGRRRLVVMFADLDNFKAINDTLGHAWGDRVLVAFADLVRRSIRGTDLAARYGGDEFVLILPDLPLAGAHDIATRIREGFGAWTAGEGLGCTVTIGVGEAPTHGTTLDAMLDAVDRAMYAAKGRGGSDAGRREVVASPSQGGVVVA